MLKEERNATKQDVIDYVKLKILNQAAAKVSWLQDLLFLPRVKRLNETSGLPFFFFASSSECRSSLVGSRRRGSYTRPPRRFIWKYRKSHRKVMSCRSLHFSLSRSLCVSWSLTQLSLPHMPGMPPISFTLIAAFIQTVSASQNSFDDGSGYARICNLMDFIWGHLKTQTNGRV